MRALLFAFLYAPLVALAADAPAAAGRPAYTPPDVFTFGSAIQAIFSLIVVLAIVAAIAWVIKKFNLPQAGSRNLLKVVSGIAVGQRERIVLVEVQDTWLVVGVAPGYVRTLHTMPRSDMDDETVESIQSGEGKFQAWLKQVMEKKNAQ
jgi:flagellar protein FliO/FliZ